LGIRVFIFSLALGLHYSWFGVIIILLIILPQAIKITREYKRGVIFRLGRFAGIRGPGLFLIIPVVDKMVKIDLWIVTLDIPAQEVITKDNIPLKLILSYISRQLMLAGQ
jgi:regulator of protease activity HflC (stomatin/prohibitin superfamily)